MASQGGKASIASTINFFPVVPNPSFAGRSHGFFWFGSTDRRTLSVYQGKTGLRQYIAQFEVILHDQCIHNQDIVQFCTAVTACAAQFLIVGVQDSLHILSLPTGRQVLDPVKFSYMPTSCCAIESKVVVGTVEGGVFVFSLHFDIASNLCHSNVEAILLPDPLGVQHGSSLAEASRMGKNRYEQFRHF